MGIRVYLVHFDNHHQARLSTYETKIVAHDAKHSISQKNRVLYEQSSYLDLGSVVSSVANFSTSFSDAASGGNQWWHHEMLAVFSGYLHMCIKRINFQHITCNYNIYR